MGEPPMGEPPMGHSPMGDSPMGESPMGAHGGFPMGDSPMGESPMGGPLTGESPMGESPMGGIPHQTVTSTSADFSVGSRNRATFARRPSQKASQVRIDMCALIASPRFAKTHSRSNVAS